MFIYHTGADKFVNKLKPAMEKSGTFNLFQYDESADLLNATLVIIGPGHDKIIPLIQSVSAKDKQISILLIEDPSRLPDIKRQVQFAPFIGKNVLCVPANAADLVSVAEGCITRTLQRRSFQKITSQTIGSMASGYSTMRMRIFDNFMSQAPIGALILDKQHQVIAINAAARSIFNIPEIDLARISLNRLLGQNAELLVSFLASKRPSADVITIAKEEIFLEVRAADMAEEDDNAATLLLVSDITQREITTQKIHAILEALPQMAWTATSTGKKDFFTGNWYRYTGISPDTESSGWEETIHPEDRAGYLKKWTYCLRKGIQFEYTARYKRFDGVYRWHLERGVPTKDPNGAVNSWTGHCTDIHNQILIQEELEAKVKERTLSLEKMNNELEQYAYVSSHDLQEPLRKIRTFVSILNERENLDPDTMKYLDKINRTAARMTKSLKDLLNFSTLQASGQWTDVDLDKVVRIVWDDLELVVAEKHATIKADPLLSIEGIQIQLYQLFYNLINNALKFSRTGIAPVIDISCIKISETGSIPYLRVKFQDNGIGFDQQHADQAFSMFRRLHSAKEYEGSGIGLAICKKVVELHKGKISVNSVVNKGSVFIVDLPLKQEKR